MWVHCVDSILLSLLACGRATFDAFEPHSLLSSIPRSRAALATVSLEKSSEKVPLFPPSLVFLAIQSFCVTVWVAQLKWSVCKDEGRYFYFLFKQTDGFFSLFVFFFVSTTQGWVATDFCSPIFWVFKKISNPKIFKCSKHKVSFAKWRESQRCTPTLSHTHTHTKHTKHTLNIH
jgi:hypothetical protein